MKIKHRASHFKDGQHLMQSDLSGRVFYSGDARKLWNGMICHKDEYEARNPQDFIRAKPERRSVLDVRPRNIEFIDKQITADDL